MFNNIYLILVYKCMNEVDIYLCESAVGFLIQKLKINKCK